MGRRGPAPASLVTLQSRGSWRAKARESTEPPAPRPGRPKCPTWLDMPARHAWARIVEALEARGVLSPDYGEAIASTAAAWGRLVRFSRLLAAVPDDDTDTLKRLSSMVKAATGDLLNGLARLGMTPADSTRLGGVKSSPTNDDNKGRFFAPKIVPKIG